MTEEYQVHSEPTMHNGILGISFKVSKREEQLWTYVPLELKQQVEGLAEKHGLSLSTTVKKLLELALQVIEEEAKDVVGE